MNSWVSPALFWLVLWFVPLAGLMAVTYFLVSLPLRRAERARFFIDLIETALREGRNAERTLMEMSQTQDRSLGVPFHLLAGYLENGVRLQPALRNVPGLLPPQITAILEVGHEIGDLNKVLPAARNVLRDETSRIISAQNYLWPFAFLTTPVILFYFPIASVFVWPRLKAVFAEVETEAKTVIDWLLDQIWLVGSVEAVIFLLLISSALVYLGGPRLVSWIEAGFTPLSDWIALQVPWKRRRLQRDFSAMLAALLDAQVPEDRALKLAGSSTANSHFMRQVAIAGQKLAAGVKLTDALASIDGTGEFQWRLANAAYAKGGFLAALAGWHEALDAKAFQQQQTFSQILTTAVVLFNGLIIGLWSVGVFQLMVASVRQAILW